MKIAVFYDNIRNGVLATRRSLEETLVQFKSEGMDKLYISVDAWRQEGHMLADLMARQGIGLEGMYGSWDFLHPADGDGLSVMIGLAADGGADHLLLVPRMASACSTREETDTIADGIARAVAWGREKGVHILMEDCDSPLSPNNCIAGLHDFMQRINGLECAFDTGNFILYHEDELAALALFMPRIHTVHLKDRCLAPRHPGDRPRRCADGRDVFCCPIGSGFIHIEQILDVLKARRYPGDVIVEMFYCDPDHVLEDISQSLRWLRAHGVG